MENSEILLNKALEALKSVDIPADYWAVGGGTVLKSTIIVTAKILIYLFVMHNF